MVTVMRCVGTLVPSLFLVVVNLPFGEAQQFVNGGFELYEPYDPSSPHFGPSSPGGWINIPVGSPALTGWRVSYGSVDVVLPGYYEPASGDASLDANGWLRGGIEQDLAFTDVTQCYIEFMFSKNAFLGAPGVLGVWYKPVGAAEFEGLGKFTFGVQNSRDDMKWTLVGTGDFTLDSGTYTFAFGSISPVGPSGPAVDDMFLRIGPSPYPAASDPGPYPPTGLQPPQEPSIPEPQAYSLAAALALVAFAVGRRTRLL